MSGSGRSGSGALSDLRRQRIAEVVGTIYRETLGLTAGSSIGHFFELGGHSLLAMRAATLLHGELGIAVPVSLVFAHPTVPALSAALDLLGADPDARAASGSAPLEAPGPDRSLSPGQRGMWFLDQAVGRRAGYLLTDAWRLRGVLQVDALGRAFALVMERHTALTTRFVVTGGEPCQVTSDPGELQLDVVDLQHLHPEDANHAIGRLIAEEADRPFDLTKDSLLRVTLSRLAAEDHVLLVTVHHLASDATSQHLLRDELARCYRAFRTNTTPDLPAIPLQYHEYARRRRLAIAGTRETDLRSYWTGQLANLPHLDFPVDRHRADEWSDSGAELEFVIAPALAERLEEVGATQQATLQMTLLAAFQMLLSQYSGQTDFGVATFASDRDDPGVQHTIGLFVNTIIVRADLSGAPTFRELLARVRRTSLEAYDHRDLPFDTLVTAARAARQGGPNPLTGVAFQYSVSADGRHTAGTGWCRHRTHFMSRRAHPVRSRGHHPPGARGRGAEGSDRLQHRRVRSRDDSALCAPVLDGAAGCRECAG
jgi:hypothetical protein